MDSIKLSKEPSNLQEDNELKNLLDSNLPHISIPNQDGNFLKLNRLDTFRLVMYCFPMTGRPDKALPKDWNLIPGASGCTLQNCSFRDHYDEIISLNAYSYWNINSICRRFEGNVYSSINFLMTF
jgi:Peroxiredoxin